MLKTLKFGGNLAKEKPLAPANDITFEMDRVDGYVNLSYNLLFTINHTNAGALTTDLYKFFKNFLINIKLNTGAGDNLFDLNPTELSIIHLMEEGKLRYTIDSTIGASVSTIFVKWNFTLPKEYERPIDTAFHAWNPKYNSVQLKLKPQKLFDSVTDCVIDSINVEVVQDFKMIPSSKSVLINGTPTVLKPMDKIIKIKSEGYNSDVSDHVIKLPTNTTILGFYVYVVDANGDIKTGCINRLSLKNGNQYFYQEDFDLINQSNRDTLDTWANTMLNDICYVDIAEGQISEALFTGAKDHINTEIAIDLTATAGTNKLQIAYVTIADA